MSTTATPFTGLIDDAVWAGVRRRRGPSRWVVAVAGVLSLLLIAVASLAVTRGYTQPQLVSDGWSGKWDAATSTIAMQVRVGNASARPITITGAEIVGPDGAPVPYARVSSLTPITMNGLLPGAVADAIYVLPMTVTVDCSSALAAPEVTPSAVLVLHTTGTWFHHDSPVLGEVDVTGFCTTT